MLEERWLSPQAVRSYETRGRLRPEEESPIRTPFQRDRDRIVHSKPFRRLRGKTQVFIDPAGDHFRTRLTHTLEAAEGLRVDDPVAVALERRPQAAFLLGNLTSARLVRAHGKRREPVLFVLADSVGEPVRHLSGDLGHQWFLR